MKAPQFVIALVAAAAVALSTCDAAKIRAVSQTTASQPSARVKKLSAEEEERAIAIQKGEALVTVKQEKKINGLNNIQITLRALQKEIAKKSKKPWYGFQDSDAVRDRRLELFVLLDQVNDVRRDLDSVTEMPGEFSELRTAINDLAQKLQEAIKQLEQMIKTGKR